jgi:hypothetical protein
MKEHINYVDLLNDFNKWMADIKIWKKIHNGTPGNLSLLHKKVEENKNKYIVLIREHHQKNTQKPLTEALRIHSDIQALMSKLSKVEFLALLNKDPK